LLVVGLIIFLILQSANQKNNQTTSLPAEISVSQAYTKYQNGAFFLDVRTQEEWNQFHAPNSTLIPLDQLPSRLNEIPKDKEIVVVCRSGNRSAQGRDILVNAGFTQVTSMQGGLTDWQAAGFPITP
jgi:rhodanese-related sulfurtransferase